jgi:hypothetical protein
MAATVKQIRKEFGPRNITVEDAEELRLAMQEIDGEFQGVRAGWASRTRGWDRANKVLGGFGVEHVFAGRGTNSPSFDYINTGDTYNLTVLKKKGKRCCLTTWGDVVERGNYE